MFYQIVSLVGAFCLLSAYGAGQMGRTGPHDRRYSAVNLLGAGLLLWVAIVDWRWGFILLETAWAANSIPPLFQRSAKS